MANGTDERELVVRQTFQVDQPGLQQSKAALTQYMTVLQSVEAQDKRLQAQQHKSAGELHTDLLRQGADAKEIARAMANYHQAINEAAEGNRFLEQTLERENNALQETANRFREKIAAARASITTDTEQTRVIQEQTRALERYQAVVAQQQQLATAALPDPTLEAVTGAGGGRQRRNRLGALGTFGTAVRNLPDVGPSTEIANVLIGVDRITGVLGISAGTAAAALGAASAALIAIGGAALIYTNLTKDQSNALIGLTRSQERYFELLRSSTTREAEAELRSAQQRLDDLRAQREELQGALDERFTREQQLTFGDFGARIRTAVFQAMDAGEEAVVTRLAELDTQLIETEGLIARLTGGLEENAFAVNDLIDAFKGRFIGTVENFTTLVTNFVDENDQRIRDQIAATNAEINFRQRALDLRRTGSVEQLNQLQQQITDEYTLNQERIRRLEDLAGRSSAADEELEKLNGRQAELVFQTQLLNREVRPVVELREREAAAAKALTEQVDQYLASLEDEVEARGNLFKAQEALNNFLTQSAEREAQIEQDARDKRFKVLQEHEAALQEQGQQAAEDEIKALREHSRRRDEINRAANLTIEEAQRNRDVAAARAAARRRDEELRKNDLTLQDRLDSLDDNLQKQKETLEKRQREQLQTIEDTARKALDAERKRAQNELATRRRAVQEAEAQLRNALNAQQLIQQNHFRQTQTMTNSAFTNIANIMATGLQTAQTAVSNFVNGLFQRVQQSSMIGPQPNRIGAGYVPPAGNPFLNIPFQLAPQPTAPTVAPYQVYQQSGLGRAPYSPTINAPTTGALEQRVLEDLRRIMRTR